MIIVVVVAVAVVTVDDDYDYGFLISSQFVGDCLPLSSEWMGRKEYVTA